MFSNVQNFSAWTDRAVFGTLSVIITIVIASKEDFLRDDVFFASKKDFLRQNEIFLFEFAAFLKDDPKQIFNLKIFSTAALILTGKQTVNYFSMTLKCVLCLQTFWFVNK
jgi:hypothetical protein